MAQGEEKNLKSVLKDLAESTSLHGVAKIVTSSHIVVKVIWFMLFAGAFAVSAMQVHDLITEYYTYPIKTKVSLKFDNLPYPAISFCNVNPVRLSQYEKSQELQDAFKIELLSEPITTLAPTTTTATTATAPERRRKREVSVGSSDSQSSSSTQSELLPEPSTMVQSSSLPTTEHPIIMSSTTALPQSTHTEEQSTMPSSSTENQTTSSTSSQSFVTPTSEQPTIRYSLEPSPVTPMTEQQTMSTTLVQPSVSMSAVQEQFNSSNTTVWSTTDQPEKTTASQDVSYEAQNGATWASTLNASIDKWTERIIKLQTQFRSFSVEERTKFGHSLEGMVHLATFAHRELKLDSTYFDAVTTTTYGNCYTLASDKFVAFRSGPRNGIQITLVVEYDEYVSEFTNVQGFRLVIHDKGTYPLPEEVGLALSPGFETTIGIRKVQMSRLGAPYGECTDGEAFREKYNHSYSTVVCVHFCRITLTAEQCNCLARDTPDIDMGLNTTRICQKKGELVCVEYIDRSINDGSLNCDCKNQCVESVYEKTLSMMPWPDRVFLKDELMASLCKNSNSKDIPLVVDACAAINKSTFYDNYVELFQLNFLQVLIYFEDLNFQSIEEEPLYEDAQFVSSIGGVMGLFVGASLLSFVEIVQCLLEVILYLYRKYVRNLGVVQPRLGPTPEQKPSKLDTDINKDTLQELKIPSHPNFVEC